MKINLYGVTGIAWIVFMVALAYGDVGTQYCTEPYIMDSSIVFSIAGAVGLPFILGFLAGRDNK